MIIVDRLIVFSGIVDRMLFETNPTLFRSIRKVEVMEGLIVFGRLNLPKSEAFEGAQGAFGMAKRVDDLLGYGAIGAV